VIEVGNRTVVLLDVDATGRGGIRVQAQRGSLFTLHDAKIVHAVFFTDWEHALAAAGLTDEDLSP
jgi:hypothetical protein